MKLELDLELDDECAGQIRMSGSDVITKNNKRVPIKEKRLLCLSQKPAIKRT